MLKRICLHGAVMVTAVYQAEAKHFASILSSFGTFEHQERVVLGAAGASQTADPLNAGSQGLGERLAFPAPSAGKRNQIVSIIRQVEREAERTFQRERLRPRVIQANTAGQRR